MTRKSKSKAKASTVVVVPTVPKNQGQTRNRKRRQSRGSGNAAPSVSNNNTIRSLLRSLGTIGGGFIGGPGGAVAGGSAGAALGDLYAHFLGKGDYEVKANSMLARYKSSGQIPAMHSLGQSVVVRHKEYIMDIVSSTSASTFAISPGIVLNPGLSVNFPWLSGIANQYQEYTWRGMIFEYRASSATAIASSTNPAMGMVTIATQYRSTAAPFTNKNQMNNEYFSSEERPYCDFIHAIECDPKENPYNVQYVRSANVPAGEDAKTYDLGTTYVATSGVQGTSAVLGELWVSYEVELRKPIQNLAGGSSALSAHIYNSNAVTAAPLGNGTATSYYQGLGGSGNSVFPGVGTFRVTSAGTILNFPQNIYGIFYVVVYWPSVSAFNPYTITAANCSLNTFTPTGGTSQTTNTTLSVGAICAYMVNIPNTGLITNQATLTFSGGSMATGSSVEIIAAQLNSNFL